MRRYAFYLSVALLAFGLGLFVVFEFCWKNDDLFQKTEFVELGINAQVQENVNSDEIQNSSKRNYVCEDKLIKPVWSKIVRDESFQVYVDASEISDKETIDCAEEFEASVIDINSDGISELAVKAKWGRFCGMYSGCWFGIFKKNSDDFENVFTNGNTFYFNLGKKSRYGFLDLIIASNAGNGNSYKNIYQFNGKNYKLRKCFWEEPAYFYENKRGEKEASKKTVITRTDCPEDEK